MRTVAHTWSHAQGPSAVHQCRGSKVQSVAAAEVTKWRQAGSTVRLTGDLILPMHIVLGGKLADGGDNSVKPPYGVTLDGCDLVLERA